MDEDNDLAPSDVVADDEVVPEPEVNAEPVPEVEIEASEELMPSDVVSDDAQVSAAASQPEPQEAEETTLQRARLITDLLAVAASCNRGETATAADLQMARDLVGDLERLGSPYA